MISSRISLDSYESLEKILKKFKSSNKQQLLISDKDDMIGDSQRALENYLMSCQPSIKISIVNVSSLPKDAKVCLFAYKDENL